MKKTSIFFATLAMSCSAAAFAQGATGNSDMTATGSMTQPETAGTVSTPSGSTYNSTAPATTPADTTTTRKAWTKPHATTGTDPNGTAAQPAGHDTGMAGSGPGVPANANGMGTTSH